MFIIYNGGPHSSQEPHSHTRNRICKYIMLNRQYDGAFSLKNFRVSLIMISIITIKITYSTIFSLYWASIKFKLPGHLGMLQALVSSRFVVHCPPYLAFSMIFLLLVVGVGCSLHDGHSDQLLHWLSLQGTENKIISKNRYHIFSWLGLLLHTWTGI